MGEELVDSDSSTIQYGIAEEDGGEDNHPFSCSEQFNRCFSWYLSIGMTPEQYWDQDSTLTIYYREAERHREDKFNRRAHLQGLYIYEALCDVAPVMVAFPAKNAKPSMYPTKPYELQYEYEGEASEESETETKTSEEIQMEKNKAKMEAFMVGFNKAFKEKKKKEEMTNG